MESIAQAITTVVGWIIRFAPLGIMGLVADSIATNGIEALIGYFQLLVLLLGSMIFVALVVNPLLSLYIFAVIHIHWFSNVYVNLQSMRSLLVALLQTSLLTSI